MKNKTPTSNPPLTVVGQSLMPKAELLTWLAGAEKQNVEFKVPVELSVSALGIELAFVGFSTDRLSAKVDDSRLGISLADRARKMCPKAKTCAVWLWANWKDDTLIVNRVDAAISDAERASATHLHLSK